ncbi:MAG: AraC family transcriptional regulator [Proteobacteria bacterium]|nr:AraC family transcriptional regulator [Pseudomonadota bacterium]
MEVFPLEKEQVYAESSFARRGILETRDPCLCEQHSGSWDLCIAPRDNSEFHNRKDYLVTPGITIYRDKYAGAVQITGALAEGLIALILPAQGEGESRYFSKTARTGYIPATESTGVAGHFGALEEHIIVLFKLPFLEQVIPPQLLEPLLRSGKEHWLPVSASGRKKLVTWLVDLLQQTEQNPQIMTNQRAIFELEKDCVNHLIQTMVVPEDGATPPSAFIRHRGFKKAVELLSSRIGPGYTIPELCRIAGVSQRTLEYAFLENIGTSPVRFVKIQRYHRLRRELILTSPAEARIQDLAMNLGLYQLGRVAREYRELFGETPSSTLRRTTKLSLAGIDQSLDVSDLQVRVANIA